MFDLKKLLEGTVGNLFPGRGVASTQNQPLQRGAPAQLPPPNKPQNLQPATGNFWGGVGQGISDVFNGAGNLAKGVNNATFGTFNDKVFRPLVVDPVANTATSLGKGTGYAFGGGMDTELAASNQAYNDLKTMHDQLKAGHINQDQFNKVAQQSAQTQANLVPVGTDISKEVDPIRQAANVANLGLTAATAGSLPAFGSNTLKGKIASGVLTGESVGGTFGALQPLQDNGRQATGLDVGIGATIGGLTGGAVGAAAPLAVKGTSKLLEMARNRGALPASSGVPFNAPEALQHIPKNVIGKDDVAGGVQNSAVAGIGPQQVPANSQPLAGALPGDNTILNNTSNRPGAAIQRQIEDALNAGDSATAQQLVNGMPEGDLKAGMQSTLAALNRPAGKETRFASTTVPASDQVSQDVGSLTRANAPMYQPATNKGSTDASLAAMQSQGIDKFAVDVSNRLDTKKGNIDRQTASDALSAARELDMHGDPASLQKAAELYDKLSGHFTAQGQSVQIASILSNRSPEGLKFQAQKALKKAGVKVTPELQKQLEAAHTAVRNTVAGSDERTRAAQEYAKIVADSLPTSFADKAGAFWKAGLLTGVKTQTGNALSNTTFGTLHAASNPLAVGIDKLISLGTGKRTKTLTGKGLVSGAGEGLQKAGAYLKSGIDERPSLLSKYDIGGATFGNQHGEVKFGKSPLGKAATTYVNGVFRLMGAADRPAYYGQLRNSLYDLAKVDGINHGLSGGKLAAHADDFVKNPPKQAFQVATDEAEKAVLGNDTFLSNVASRVRQAAHQIDNPLGRNVATGVVNTVAPFTKVPSAFISRVLDFTPVGAVKTAAEQISRKQLDQRALSTAISEATTGSGIIYLGAQLANNDMLSGNYPDDPKEQARWKAQGIQPNSVKVGNNWLSLNYFGPVGSLFNQGKRIVDTQKSGGGAVDVAAGATTGAVQDALGQSFLQGVSGVLDAVNDPKRYAANYAKNQAGSVVPTLSNDLAQALDKWQRDAASPGEAIQSRIPGAREGLPIKQDVYGNKLEAKADSANTIANPFRPSSTRTNDVLGEVERLHNVDQNNKDLQVTPTPVDKTATFDGVKVNLTDQQRYDLQNLVGQKTQELWAKLITTPEYKALHDTEKAKALGNLRQDATAVAQREYAAKNNLGQYSPDFTGKAKKPTRSQKNLTNSGDVTDYTKASSGRTTTADYAKSPDAEYKAKLDQYFQDKKAGEVTPVQDIKRQAELKRLQTGATYDKDLRDLYSLSKAQIADYVTTNPDGNKLVEQLKSYDNALVDAGVIDKAKFAKGIAPAPKKAARSGSKRTARKPSMSRFGFSTFKGTSSQRHALRAIVRKAGS